jgi:hypothetical protein
MSDALKPEGSRATVLTGIAAVFAALLQGT